MDLVWLIFLFALGACVGSFLNVVIWRYPRSQSVVFPPSHCPACGRAIRWSDNIPLVSWLVLRGRCRSCKQRISPRYLLLEAATGLMVAGLYAYYFMYELRAGAGSFEQAWPMYAAHAGLLCVLLAASMIDLAHWIVPVEACWIIALAGGAAATADPHPFWPDVSPHASAVAVGMALGLVIGLAMLKFGLLQRSFIDADENPVTAETLRQRKDARRSPGRKNKKDRPAKRKRPGDEVIVSANSGCNPRVEVLRELLFLAPALTLGVVGWLVVEHFPAARQAWTRWTSAGSAPHVNALMSAWVGFLVGGAWIWGTRILGTLGFGKEAMGMGDVHLMAGAGAVVGWKAISLAYWAAPMMALVLLMWLVLLRRQRALPFGPWLAAGTVAVMLAYDPIVAYLTEALAL